MSVGEVIERIRTMSPEERNAVARVVEELDGKDETWIPAGLRSAMKDLSEGRTFDLDERLLSLKKPPEK
jgi:hypothetical protein